jgi:uncharacterized membrane protein
MERNFAIVVLLFFTYSFIGWLWETVYVSAKEKHFVYRGFLIGPITPIYGFGVLGVLYLVEPWEQNIVVLFVVAAILVTILEYLTSLLLEKMFHATLWDYHNMPLNINGRVAVPVSLFWGLGCVLIVKVIHPILLAKVTQVADRFGIFLPMGLLMIMSCDLGYTLANVAAFTKAVTEMGQAIEGRKQELRDGVTELRTTAADTLDAVKEETALFKEKSRKQTDAWLQSLTNTKEDRKKLPQLNFQERRLLKSFPNLKLKDSDVKNSELRALLKRLRQK